MCIDSAVDPFGVQSWTPIWESAILPVRIRAHGNGSIRINPVVDLAAKADDAVLRTLENKTLADSLAELRILDAAR